MFVTTDLFITSKQTFLDYAISAIESWDENYTHLRIDASKNALFYSNGEFIKGNYAWHLGLKCEFSKLKTLSEIQSSEPFVITKEEFLKLRENNNEYVG